MILNIGYCTLTEENIKNQSKKKKKHFWSISTHNRLMHSSYTSDLVKGSQSTCGEIKTPQSKQQTLIETAVTNCS